MKASRFKYKLIKSQIRIKGKIFIANDEIFFVELSIFTLIINSYLAPESIFSAGKNKGIDNSMSIPFLINIFLPAFRLSVPLIHSWPRLASHLLPDIFLPEQ